LRYAFVTRVDGSDDLIACGPSDFYDRTTEQQRRGADSEDGIGDAYVPDSIKHLVKECTFDEVNEVVGPFMEKMRQLIEENANERDVRRTNAAIRPVLDPGSEALERMAAVHESQETKET
jgi:hypothetical protein